MVKPVTDHYLTPNAIGRNPNWGIIWIVAASAPPYFCIIKNDLVKGRNQEKKTLIKFPSESKTLNKHSGINLRWRVLGDETSPKDPDLNGPPFPSFPAGSSQWAVACMANTENNEQTLDNRKDWSGYK